MRAGLTVTQLAASFTRAQEKTEDTLPAMERRLIWRFGVASDESSPVFGFISPVCEPHLSDGIVPRIAENPSPKPELWAAETEAVGCLNQAK